MSRNTAGDEIPASTEVFQSRVPVCRSIAYTYPSLEGTIRREPAIAGEAAMEPDVVKNHFFVPLSLSSAKTPYGGLKLTWLVVLYVPMMPTYTVPFAYAGDE